MMGLFGMFKKKDAGAVQKRKFTRLFFATDIHGSQLAYRKLLKAPEAYDTEIIVLGGDVTGKFLIPVITASDGTKRVTLHGQRREIKTGQEMQDLITNLGVLGYYSVEMTEAEFNSAYQDETIVDAIFLREQCKRLNEWVSLADERFQGTGIKMYVTGGNDDSVEALDALEGIPSEHVIPCENKHVMIDELHTMVSLGISNLTPWHTPREFPEEVVAQRIEEAVRGIDDFTNVIFNFHVPPHGQGLDMCPELDTTKDPPAPVMHGGEHAFKPAGSTAVLEAIRKYQPLLVLTGHIHESRGTVQIGRTFALNPGTAYGEGPLRGTLVNLGDGKIVSWQMTSG
jgi:Icc-related predicted phosphoesterase